MLRMCDDEPDCNAATAGRRRSEKKQHEKKSHFVLVSDNSGRSAHATRHRLGNSSDLGPFGQDAIQPILQGFQEWHGDV